MRNVHSSLAAIVGACEYLGTVHRQGREYIAALPPDGGEPLFLLREGGGAVPVRDGEAQDALRRILREAGAREAGLPDAC